MDLELAVINGETNLEQHAVGVSQPNPSSVSEPLADRSTKQFSVPDERELAIRVESVKAWLRADSRRLAVVRFDKCSNTLQVTTVQRSDVNIDRLRDKYRYD